MQNYAEKRATMEREYTWRLSYATLLRARAAHLEHLEALRHHSFRQSPGNASIQKRGDPKRRFASIRRSGERFLSALRPRPTDGSTYGRTGGDCSIPVDIFAIQDIPQPSVESNTEHQWACGQLDGESEETSFVECQRSVPLSSYEGTPIRQHGQSVLSDEERPHKIPRLAPSPEDKRHTTNPRRSTDISQMLIVPRTAAHEQILGKNNHCIDALCEPTRQSNGQPQTIVRRSRPQQRGALFTNKPTPQLSTICTVGTINPAVTDGSSPGYYSSLSPRDTSTAPTSTSVGSREKIAGPSGSRASQGIYSLPPIREVSVEEPKSNPLPSIRTLEATANAKSFLENHFNSVLGMVVSSREARRVELEAKLSVGNLREQTRFEQRWRWLELESSHMRNSRVSKTREVCKSTSERTLTIAGYEFKKTLGKGSFGVVKLARRKITTEIDLARPRLSCRSDVCAVKIIRKSDMLRNTQEAHIRAERDILVAASRSCWIVQLIESFQDRTNLYLAMEFMVGGDFLGLLIRWDRIEEHYTRFYVAEMILCVQEAHRLGYIHRDVKPDNFLISASGHLKISDFGLAFDGHWSHDQGFYNHQRHSLLERLGITINGDETDREEMLLVSSSVKPGQILNERGESSAVLRHSVTSNNEVAGAIKVLNCRNWRGMRKLARSVVGTSQYMAPEVIRGDDYDGRCDWWSIGIILFECLYGETPFIGEDRQATKYNIVHHDGEMQFIPNSRIERRYHVSGKARDLVNRLLQEKEARLSCQTYGQNDIGRNCTQRQAALSHSADSVSKITPRFLYPDDAADIKAHPFFAGINWNTLHLISPPEVPKIRRESDTKYFEPGSQASDTTADLRSSSVGAAEHTNTAHLQSAASPRNRRPGDLLGATSVLSPSVSARKAGHRRRKGQKRPRDCILRDQDVATVALQERKKGAFLGYAYRQPQEILGFLDSLLDDLHDGQ